MGTLGFEVAAEAVKRRINRAFSFCKEKNIVSYQRRNTAISFINRLHEKYESENWEKTTPITHWELEETYGIPLSEYDQKLRLMQAFTSCESLDEVKEKMSGFVFV